jgi:hypothetical protein
VESAAASAVAFVVSAGSRRRGVLWTIRAVIVSLRRHAPAMSVSLGSVGATMPLGTFASGASLRPPSVSLGSVGAICPASGSAVNARQASPAGSFHCVPPSDHTRRCVSAL